MLINLPFSDDSASALTRRQSWESPLVNITHLILATLR